MGMMELWDKSPEDMEGEIDKDLPAGKYVLRYLRGTPKVTPSRDDPEKTELNIYLQFSAVRPLEGNVTDFNPAAYETILHTFWDKDSAQFIRFLKATGWDGSMHPKEYLPTLVGCQFVADVTYTPNKKEGGKPYKNLRGLIPLSVFEERMAKLQGASVATSHGDSDDLE